MYLLDTDTIIYNLKGERSVRRALREHIQDPMNISIITLTELLYGAYKSQHPDANLARIRAIEQSFEVLPTGEESADTFARLKSELERQGTRLDDFDLLIASCALAHNLILVSNNTRHFTRIPSLRLESWAG
jgi:predicted nucleic acid-binding protein